MLWYYGKISETPEEVVYAYGWNTKKMTGQLGFNKKTKEVFVLKIAENDSQDGAEWAAGHLGQKVGKIEKDFPQHTMVMIG
ncbi:MAG: hypothetical protein MdMp014T_0587 [Treponematales bacterium]